MPRINKRLKSLKVIQTIKNLFSRNVKFNLLLKLLMRNYKRNFLSNKQPIKSVIQNLAIQLVCTDFQTSGLFLSTGPVLQTSV